MTGEEHHAEAERLIEMARDAATDMEFGGKGLGRCSLLYKHSHMPRDTSAHDRGALLLADAQVHAILALAVVLGAEGPATEP
jgi:hypothetical protein